MSVVTSVPGSEAVRRQSGDLARLMPGFRQRPELRFVRLLLYLLACLSLDGASYRTATTLHLAGLVGLEARSTARARSPTVRRPCVELRSSDTDYGVPRRGVEPLIASAVCAVVHEEPDGRGRPGSTGYRDVIRTRRGSSSV
jgi:hypothetical protein